MNGINKQLSYLLNSFYNLPLQEKAVAFFGMLAVLGMIVGGVLWSVESHIDKKERRLENRKAKLMTILAKKQELETAQRKMQYQEDILKRSGSVRLFPLLEELSKKLDVEIGDMNERHVISPAENIKVVAVEVHLRKITLEKLTQFLFQIENTEYIIKVTNLRVKQDFTTKQYLEVTFTVSTYKLAT